MKKAIGIFAVIGMLFACSSQKHSSTGIRRAENPRHMDSVAQGGDIMKKDPVKN